MLLKITGLLNFRKYLLGVLCHVPRSCTGAVWDGYKAI